MSTIKVNSIKNTTTDDGGIAIDNSGHVQIDGQQLPAAGALSNRSCIINGSMQVSQRGTSTTGITTTTYPACDRWALTLTSLGTWTGEQSTDSPDGYSNSFKVTCTTADASPAAGDLAIVETRLEGQNVQHFGYGTSGAKSVTLSFWVKSNKTGTASFEAYQLDASPNRQVSKPYTINAANTWEHKTITLPADTAGTIDNDNTIGFSVIFWMNSGSTYTGGTHQTTWGGVTNANRNAENLGVGGAVNDYFQITGVQLEVGEKATPFEHRSFGDELARCQRYYQSFSLGKYGAMGLIGRKSGSGTVEFDQIIPFGPMRTTPTGNWTGDVTGFQLTRLYDNTQATPTGVTIGGANANVFVFFAATTSYSTAQVIAQFASGTSSTQSFELISEL